MKDENDEVMYEIPCYLSRNLSEALYVHQNFENQSVSGTLNINNARVKPVSQHVELPCELDTSSEQVHYAKHVHLSRSDNDYNPGFTLKSQQCVNDVKNYAVGVLREGEMHFTAVQGIVYYRCDKGNFNHENTSKSKARDGDGDGDEEELTPVTVKFARQDNIHRTRKPQEKSFKYLSQQETKEPWMDATTHPCGSHQSEVETDMLACHNNTVNSSNTNMDANEFRQTLVRGLKSGMGDGPANRQFPLKEQLEQLLRRAQVVSFSEILEFVQPHASPTDILREIQPLARLVQGNWVLRSEALYDDKKLSSISGVECEKLKDCREYILCIFKDSACIQRNNIPETLSVPPHELLGILKQIANITVINGERCWEFKKQPDMDFIQRYPELVQRQNYYWTNKLTALRSAPDTVVRPPQPKLTGRRRNKTHSFSSDNESGNESKRRHGSGKGDS